MVVQIARKFDKKVMILLLKRRGGEVQITEEVVKAVQMMETFKSVLSSEHPDSLTSIGNLASTFWN